MSVQSLHRLFVVAFFGLLGLTSCHKTCPPPSHGTKTDTLTTFYGEGNARYEYHYVANDVHDFSDPAAPELDATTWTINGELVHGRDLFRFNMDDIPANATIKSAKLSLFSNLNPLNGDLVHANAGPTNAMYIYRVSSNWTTAGGWNWVTQPTVDNNAKVLIPHTDQSILDLVDVDVTALVQKMVSSGNYGFQIRLQSEVVYNSRMFYLTAAADPSKRPKLVVTY